MDQYKDAKEIDQEMAKLAIERSLVLERQLQSNDVNDIFKAATYIEEQKKLKKNDVKAFLFDPYEAYYQYGGYKQQRKRVGFDVLKKISETPIVGSAINTRIFQMQNFLRFVDDENQEGYTVRKKKSLFEKNKKEPTTEEKKKIEFIVNFLESGGLKSKWDMSDDIAAFTRKVMRDSLSYDQTAAECQRNRRGELIGFYAIDASTIRLLETIDPKFKDQAKAKYREQFGQYPRYGQVFQGNIIHNAQNEEVIYYPWELMYEQRNKSTDIDKNGYGTSEIEILLDIITWSLWGMQYNGNFFKQGSNPKGFINLKDDGVNIDILNDFRQTWRQMIAGVNNCIHGDTNITTLGGYTRIGDLFINNKEDKFDKIWDGEEFVDGRIYMSGLKELNSITFNNGITEKTSPNHLFKVIEDKTGLPVWKKRSEMKIGDYVLVNRNSVQSQQTPLQYKGKELESDLFEVLGWAIGDGWFGQNKNRLRRMSLFYHRDKERDILKRHLDVLKKYGINCTEKEHFYSDKEIERLKSYNQFKSVSKSNVKIDIFDADFVRFLFSLGFKSSCDKKEIPKFMFSYHSEHKCAFLRGFFSADAHVMDGRNIQMTIVNDILREQTKHLLLTEGIRCSQHEGKIRSNTRWGTLKAGYMLLIRDNKEYFEKVGMLQVHKQYKPNKTGSYNTKESIHPITAINITTDIRKFINKTKQTCSKRERALLSEIIRGQGTSHAKILELAAKFGYKLPEFMTNYSFSRVVAKEESGELAEMYDVEMYNNKHQFIANGILNHNSHKIPVFAGLDMEWIDLQSTNKDMEFQNWMDFLIIMICSVFTIDPSELGFQFQKQAQVFGQDGQKERLAHSKNKGLKPLLVFYQQMVTKYLVSEIDSDYEFVFCGLDVEDEAARVDIDAKKLQNGMISMESAFEKNMGRKFDPKKDTILNSVYQQAQSMKMYGGGESNEAVDEMTGEPDGGMPNPFQDPMEKSIDSNPFVNGAMKYFEDHTTLLQD